MVGLAALPLAASLAAGGPVATAREAGVRPHEPVARVGIACPRSVGSAGRAHVEDLQCLVNRRRARAGLAALRLSPALARSALLKADAIGRCGEFSHTACGQPLLAVFELVGYASGSFWTVGENLALLPEEQDSAHAALAAWLRSPSHRRVLLDPGFRELGVALVQRPPSDEASGGSTLWVAHFGRRD